MAFTYIESGKHLIGENLERFTGFASVRLCSAQPVSSTSLNELSGNGYSAQFMHTAYNPHAEVLENNSQIVFGPATANWDPITHILLNSGRDAFGIYRGSSDGVFSELNSSITVQSGDSLVLEPGAIKIGLSRIYDGVGAAANFITPADANVLFAGSNFINAVFSDDGRFPTRNEFFFRGFQVHLKLLTGEPTPTDFKETVPDFPAGVEIVLYSTGTNPTKYFRNPIFAWYGPFASGVTFTHFAIGESRTLRSHGSFGDPRITPATHEADLFNMYGYDTLSSPVVIPPNHCLYLPPFQIQTSQAALT